MAISKLPKSKPKNKIKSAPKKPVTTSGPKEAARARQSANRGLHKATGSTLTTRLNDDKISKVQNIKPEHRSSLKRDTVSLNKFKADATKRDMKDITRARKADMKTTKPSSRSSGKGGIAAVSAAAGYSLGSSLKTLSNASKNSSSRASETYSAGRYAITGTPSSSDKRILSKAKRGMK